MTNPTDVMAQVQATMTEALDKIPEHVDVRSAIVTVCLDTAKRLAATEEILDVREFWAKSSTRPLTSWRRRSHPGMSLSHIGLWSHETARMIAQGGRYSTE